MASKDRILRLKEDTRVNILTAALQIVKEEGWQALSMRKIADVIEYTAPIIYEYFANKEAILQELARQGYKLLFKQVQEAKSNHQSPAKQLEAMWLAYWNFAFAEKEMYQIMFGVETSCCMMQKGCPEVAAYGNLFMETIKELMGDDADTENAVCTKYYTLWSVVHGLISINIVRQGQSDEINKQVLTDAIAGIINSIKN